MFLQSIRWRLPLSYAGIAFTVALILGIALLATLRGYYWERERQHLENNALAISETVRQLQLVNLPRDEINTQLLNLAFILQVRVRMLNAEATVIADSGTPSKFLSISYDETLIVSSEPITASRAFPASAIIAPTAFPYEAFTPAAVVSADESMSVFAVSSTPFGFDLAGEMTQGVLSDQVVRMPIYGTDGVLEGYVELSEGASFGAHIVDSVAAALVFASLLALGIAACIGLVISRQITTPLLALTEGAQRMARGDLHMRVHLNARGELGALAHTFNDMAQQVEATITALRRFVADAAHELHTPLTALHADLELAATEIDPARQTFFARRASHQVRRIEVLADNLLNLSRLESKASTAPLRSIDLVRLTHDFIEVYASRAEQAGLTFSLAIPDTPLMVRGDAEQLRRALSNLLDNAIKFTPDGGAITLRLEQISDRVCITVSDSGIGIPDEDVPHLFQRFYRGRNTHHIPGSGLGLAIIRAILDLHHGDISVQSAPGDTRFVLSLPGG